jgi:hypothetical protein
MVVDFHISPIHAGTSQGVRRADQSFAACCFLILNRATIRVESRGCRTVLWTGLVSVSPAGRAGYYASGQLLECSFKQTEDCRLLGLAEGFNFT